MAMSMLASFFDIRKSSRNVFEGLEIMEQPELCAAWMNQWPTVFFSLKDIDGLTFENAMGQFRLQLADLYKQYVFLLDSDRIDPDDKVMFLKIKAAEADDIELSRSLLLLMRMLQNCYQKPVILLLDEYDVPVAKASSHGYYDRMMEVIKIMMSTALKDNPYLCFAVVTGCLKIAKESIFTGTNNFVSDTISDSRLNEYFGFTSQEMKQILQDADAGSRAEEQRNWKHCLQAGISFRKLMKI